jgi:hypothetical protein
VEHVGVGLEGEEVAGVIALCESEEIGKVAVTLRDIDPFLRCALGSIAVVVDGCGVPRNDLYNTESVSFFMVVKGVLEEDGSHATWYVSMRKSSARQTYRETSEAV